ncbi:hypothetical protein OIE62_25400 [Streptomyces scopuliridis]|uniref:Uncharacterized protein n=1 Tax=Streptomyces scopuliridis TaxID=452529 RepID=A0ACD4ZJG0_9ACTN|nr:hypothetical protein [Streptomyces scopuliridis]WSB34013.1 hypothetical protein OG949_14815 [Streptomyces scopuliridis]WSB98295.1 hypothetical protein OG835_15540 [Streptomyces scopuliridis]WSC08003.1 hypothetical protein OIE62_25400 [Streptomyces scopuliridis]
MGEIRYRLRHVLGFLDECLCGLYLAAVDWVHGDVPVPDVVEPATYAQWEADEWERLVRRVMADDWRDRPPS